MAAELVKGNEALEVDNVRKNAQEQQLKVSGVSDSTSDGAKINKSPATSQKSETLQYRHSLIGLLARGLAPERWVSRTSQKQGSATTSQKAQKASS